MTLIDMVLRCLIFWVLFFICTVSVRGQGNLSEKQQAKLSSIESGHKRMLLYFKYCKKDSIRRAKEQRKHDKHVLDSIWKVSRYRQKLSAKNNGSLNAVLGIDSDIRMYRAIYEDSTSSDSLRSNAKEQLKQLVVQKARLYPGFQAAMDKHQLGMDSSTWKDLSHHVPGLDSLSGVFDSSPEELFATAEKSAEKSVENYLQANYLQKGNMSVSKGELERLNQMKSQYEAYKNSLSNTDSLKTAGKDRALAMVGDHFKDHQEVLTHAQGKVNRLLGKYRSFSNSNDLKDAVKHTSLKGKSFKERLLLGGNFNIITVRPLSIDLTLQAGYKFNTRFAVGLGASHRLTFGDSIRTDRYVSPRNTSFSMFTSYDILKSVFAYSEWNTSGARVPGNDMAASRWVNNYFVGVGKKFLVHPKLYLTMMALYNLNSDTDNPVFLKRFQIRIGFQLSELATRKKKVFYDPNR